MHVASKCFLRATREKNSENSTLYNLKLARKGGAGVYFKFLPHYSFKKEGERMRCEDKFYIYSMKLSASIVYKDVPKIDPPITF